MKERLIQLIQEASNCSRYFAEFIAEHIIENFEMIPIAVIKRKIDGIDAADGCDQAGRWDYQMRSALRDVLDWYTTPNYKETVEHTWRW